jgi:cbb3-type cytochrome oxidase maturation protein
MDVVWILVLLSLLLVGFSLLFFLYSMKQGDHEHADRLSLMPLASAACVRCTPTRRSSPSRATRSSRPSTTHPAALQGADVQRPAERLHFWGWQLIIVSAALTLPFGITQGKEYAELEWPIDLAIAVVWAGFFGVNFFGTLVKRRERHMYVALWFYIATIVTVAMLHIFNNLWMPVGDPSRRARCPRST